MPVGVCQPPPICVFVQVGCTYMYVRIEYVHVIYNATPFNYPYVRIGIIGVSLSEPHTYMVYAANVCM